MADTTPTQVEVPGGINLTKPPATIAERSADTRRAYALRHYRELTERELLIWDGHLPNGDCDCLHCEIIKLEDHDVPPELRQELVRISETGPFDFVQIWMPRDDSTERLALGVIASNCSADFADWDAFLLARWGKDLPSYEEIESEVTLTALREYSDMVDTEQTKEASEVTVTSTVVQPEVTLGAGIAIAGMWLAGAALTTILMLVVADSLADGPEPGFWGKVGILFFLAAPLMAAYSGTKRVLGQKD